MDNINGDWLDNLLVEYARQMEDENLEPGEDCLTEKQIRSVIEEDVDKETIEHIREHLEQCKYCQSKVAMILHEIDMEREVEEYYNKKQKEVKIDFFSRNLIIPSSVQVALASTGSPTFDIAVSADRTLSVIVKILQKQQNCPEVPVKITVTYQASPDEKLQMLYHLDDIDDKKIIKEGAIEMKFSEIDGEWKGTVTLNIPKRKVILYVRPESLEEN